MGNGGDLVACYNLTFRALPWQVEGPKGGAGPLVRFIQAASLESLLAPKSIANLPQRVAEATRQAPDGHSDVACAANHANKVMRIFGLRQLRVCALKQR